MNNHEQILVNDYSQMNAIMLMSICLCTDHRCKKRFYVFYFGYFFKVFYFVNVFYFKKKRWQNRRVSKRKNGNEIIQFNNIIYFSRVD